MTRGMVARLLAPAPFLVWPVLGACVGGDGKERGQFKSFRLNRSGRRSRGPNKRRTPTPLAHVRRRAMFERPRPDANGPAASFGPPFPGSNCQASHRSHRGPNPHPGVVFDTVFNTRAAAGCAAACAPCKGVLPAGSGRRTAADQAAFRVYRHTQQPAEAAAK